MRCVMTVLDVPTDKQLRDRFGLHHPISEVIKANSRRRGMLEKLILVHGKEHPLVTQLEKAIAEMELMVLVEQRLV